MEVRTFGFGWAGNVRGFIVQRCSQESNFGTIVIFILVNRLHERLLNKLPGNDAGVKE